jgi:hypothetical protein
MMQLALLPGEKTRPSGANSSQLPAAVATNTTTD